MPKVANHLDIRVPKQQFVPKNRPPSCPRAATRSLTSQKQWNVLFPRFTALAAGTAAALALEQANHKSSSRKYAPIKQQEDVSMGCRRLEAGAERIQG
jgi:hypothetical protein